MFAARHKRFAALIEYHHDGAYSCRAIVEAASPWSLLEQVSDGVISRAGTLLEAPWEVVSAYSSDVNDWLQYVCEEELDAAGLSLETLVAVFRKLASEDAARLKESQDTDTDSVLGYWYKEVSWLTEAFCEESYVHVPVEGPLPEFVSRMLAWEAGRYGAKDLIRAPRISTRDLVWVGQLAVLSTFEEHRWQYQDTIRVFRQLVDQFNRDNG